jgi:hypothetical protein
LDGGDEVIDDPAHLLGRVDDDGRRGGGCRGGEERSRGSGASAPEVAVNGGAEVPDKGATAVEGGEDDMIEREQADTKLIESTALLGLGRRL